MSSEERTALNWFRDNHYKELEKLASEELSAVKYHSIVSELCTKKLEEFVSFLYSTFDI